MNNHPKRNMPDPRKTLAETIANERESRTSSIGYDQSANNPQRGNEPSRRNDHNQYRRELGHGK